ncbi:hypothetical protein LguiB_031041 [Lonicera macranthoides]
MKKKKRNYQEEGLCKLALNIFALGFICWTYLIGGLMHAIYVLVFFSPSLGDNSSVIIPNQGFKIFFFGIFFIQKNIVM